MATIQVLNLRVGAFLLAYLALAISSVSSAEPQATAEDKTNLEVIEIVMPRPMMKLDFRNPEPKLGVSRHCIKDTGTRLRHKGTGRCVVGSGLSVNAKDLKHRGWEDLSPSANALRPRNH